MTADRPDQPKESLEKRRFRSASLNWLLPNMLTIAGLISGLTGLRFALDELWISATTMIVLAAIFDALDGRMARLLKTTSEFGAALDSLSDAVVFGIVPAPYSILMGASRFRKYRMGDSAILCCLCYFTTCQI